MTKKEQIESLSKRLNCSRVDALNFIEAYQGLIIEAIKHNGEFQITGIGNFKVKLRNARTGRNPRTGSTIQIPQHHVVGFKASNSLTQLINVDSQ